MFKAKQWVALLEYIDGLPAASRFNEAVSNDPEAARMLAQMQIDSEESGKARSWRPRVAEYKLENIQLGALISEMKRMNQALSVQITQKKPDAETPFPTPLTAIDLEIEAIERERTVELAALFGFGAEDIF